MNYYFISALQASTSWSLNLKETAKKMKVPIFQALTDKVGFAMLPNTVSYSDRIGIMGRSRPLTGVYVKSNSTGWEPWHSCQLKVRKERQNKKRVHEFTRSYQVEDFWMNGMRIHRKVWYNPTMFLKIVEEESKS